MKPPEVKEKGKRKKAKNERQKEKGKRKKEKLVRIFVFYLLPFTFFLLFSCRSEPADLRKLAPVETLIYLETNDLGKTLQSLTENKAFQELAKNNPDFSALENMQMAIAVTGFETSQTQVTTEQSVLNFKPHFVAIAETHAWEWQTRSFVEEKLGNFINDVYGGEVELEVSNKNGGEWYVWTAQDGRKVFAFVQASQIFFGNDETAVEKCLAVRRGEGESLLKNENFVRAFSADAKNNLAFGYVSAEGIGQIANLAGVSTAMNTSEEESARSFIASVLPKFLRNTTKEIVWTANKNEKGIEDVYAVSLSAEVNSMVKETLTGSAENQTNLAEFLPSDIFTATRYNLKNPLLAWQSLPVVIGKSTDNLSGNLLLQFSGSLLEPYGISDADNFLGAVDSNIFTAQFDAEGEKTVAVVTVKDAEKIKKSMAEINFKLSPEKQENAEIWKSKEGEIAAAFVANTLILGDGESVLKCLQAKQSGQNFTKNANYQKFAESRAVAVTFGKDAESARKIAAVLSELKEADKGITTNYLTETGFTERGIARQTVSPFGLIGTILEQFEGKE